MSQLPATQENHVPVPIAPDLDRALASISSAIDWGTGRLPADRALPPALRERLAIRADVLAGWLAGAGPSEVRVRVAALLAVLPVQGSKGDAADADRIQGLYARALANLPLFAIKAACATALTRGVGGKKFAPSPAELRAEAEREARAWRTEAAKIRRVLEARLEVPRPLEDVRKASAAAARSSFGIPERGLGEGRPHRVEMDPTGSLGQTAADITAKSDAAMARYREAQRVPTEPPAGRFAEDAA